LNDNEEHYDDDVMIHQTGRNYLPIWIEENSRMFRIRINMTARGTQEGKRRRKKRRFLF
jgi:hypothetical protein